MRSTVRLLVVLLLLWPAVALAAPATAATRSPVVFGTFEASGGDELAQHLATYKKLAGTAPEVVNYFTDWSPKQFPVDNLKIITATGATPLVTWQPQQFGKLSPDKADPAHSLTAIANGADDGYIRQWARAAKAFGSTIYIRLAHEMNGNWYAWGRGVDGNTPAEYREMFQHVHDIFVDVGAKNVKWVWCPNVIYTSGSDPQPYYPGSAYVDVVGLDGYNWGTRAAPYQWTSFADIFDPTIDTLSSYAAGKPVWIVETGSTEDGGDKGAWLQDMFATAISDERISGLIYFDAVGTGDWPLSTSTAASAGYRKGLTELRVAQGTLTPAAAKPTLKVAQLKRHTAKARAVRMSGKAAAHAKVTIQRKVGRKWRKVKVVHATAKGRYTARGTLPHGRVTLRARAGNSAYRVVRVRIR